MAAPLQVLDADNVVQPLSTTSDGSNNLVTMHAPGVTNSSGVTAPVTATNPLPVVNASGAAAIDGSGTIAVGNTAQFLFASAVPPHGYMIQNNSAEVLWVSDVGVATANGSSFQIAINGGTFITPPGYRPGAAVSILGGTTGQVFAARSW